MKKETIYQCDVCGQRSNDRAKIEACEATPIRGLGLTPGDIVFAPYSQYGWWDGSEAWFKRLGDDEDGDRRGPGPHGWPLYVVLGEIEKTKVSNMNGPSAHQMATLLYSPDHANYRGRRHYAWTSPDHITIWTKVGSVSDADLKRYRRDAGSLAPGLF